MDHDEEVLINHPILYIISVLLRYFAVVEKRRILNEPQHSLLIR